MRMHFSATGFHGRCYFDSLSFSCIDCKPFIVGFRQWLSRNKLEPLGANSAFDTTRIMEIKQCKLRQDVRRAYDEATQTCSVVSTHKNSFSKP